jgi:hypothetical protein
MWSWWGTVGGGQRRGEAGWLDWRRGTEREEAAAVEARVVSGLVGTSDSPSLFFPLLDLVPFLSLHFCVFLFLCAPLSMLRIERNEDRLIILCTVHVFILQ